MDEHNGTYLDILTRIVKQYGWMTLLSRGLLTRIFSNGIQSVFFVVIWKILSENNYPRSHTFEEVSLKVDHPITSITSLRVGTP